MKYGKLLNKGSTIGVIAPSFGCSGYPYVEREKQSRINIKNLGYKEVACKSLLKCDLSNLLKTNKPRTKAKEFMEQYLDPNIDLIISWAGGEIMNQTIDYISFNKLKKATPKMFVGYSDNTWLSFLLPTICDVASGYGYNFRTLGSYPLHHSVKNYLNVLSSKKSTQISYDFIEVDDLSKVEGGDPLAPINDTYPSHWKSLNGKEVKASGRIIGGCLDILLNIIGTKYDKVKEFNNKYKKDGFIYYFESCDLNLLSQLRGYDQIINANWLKYAKAILIGRPLNKEPMFGSSYEQMLHNVFDKLKIPVIYDVDIGHIPPTMLIINGSYATVEFKNNKGKLIQELK